MILEAIFNGQIYPADDVVPKGKDYKAIREEIAESINDFEQTMNENEYANMEKLIDNMTDLQSMKNKEHFKYGFSLGVLMMKEIYDGFPEYHKKA